MLPEIQIEITEAKTKEARQEIRALIKSLSKEQKERKKLLSQDHRTLVDHVVCRLQGEKTMAKMKITVLLNLYHELRGSSHRHLVREEHMWYAPRLEREYRSKYLST